MSEVDEMNLLLARIPSGVRHVIEAAPDGAHFRDFTTQQPVGKFIAAVADQSDIDCCPIGPLVVLPGSAGRKGVGYGLTRTEALRNALTAYEASA